MGAVVDAIVEIIQVLPYTVFLALIILVLGVFLGSLIAVAEVKRISFLLVPIEVYISYIRGIPLVVQLFIAQAAFPKVIEYFLTFFFNRPSKVSIPSFLIVVICYSLFEGAVESENIRGLLNAFDKSQFEAGLSIGMRPMQVIWRIAVPQLIYTAVPLLLNAFLKIIRTLSVAFLVGVVDIMASARYKAALSSEYIASYVAVALIYWGICLFVQALIKKFGATLKYID